MSGPTVSVTPGEVISLTLSPSTVVGGPSNTVTGTLNITPGYTGTTPTTVTLTSNSGSAIFANGTKTLSLTVNPGDTAPTFTLTTKKGTAAQGTVTVTITVVSPFGYPSRTAQLPVTP